MLKLQTKPQLEAERLKRAFSLVMLQQAKQIPKALTFAQIETIVPIAHKIEEVAILSDDSRARELLKQIQIDRRLSL